MSSDSITRLNAALDGRYRIESELGEGGMANVYLADDLKHERNVALKVLKPELAAVVGAERFLTEIKTTANLQHPHILPLHDSGEADGFLFYVMPYIAGETLRDRLEREHQLPVDEAVRIASDVAEALQAAHEQGVIHRDIKPANILLSRGRPLVADFGIALAVNAAGGGRLTETGLSLGTPHYMSPEQATGDLNVGATTDVYALGCVLYEMLVGEPPYTGSTAQAILGKIIAGEVPSAKAERASVPPNVDAVIAKALEKVPADRFTTARAFRSALENPAFRARAENRAASPAWRPVTAVVATGGWVLAAAALGLWLLPRNDVENPSGSRSTLHASFALPDSAPLAVKPSGRQLALSPDGSTLVYVAQRGSATQLYKRALDDSLVTAIPGTEGATEPFFSPDGAWVGFRHDQDRVSKVPTAGGPVEAVGSGVYGFGATWIPGAMVASSQDGGELVVFPDDGGVADTVRPRSRLRNLATLPDPAWVLGTLQDYRAGVVEVATGEVFLLTPRGPRRYAEADESGGLRGTSFQYLPSGHILFLRTDGVVAAAPFDAASLSATGSEQTLLQGVRVNPFTGSEQLAVGPSGTLVYAGGANAMAGQPSFVDEQGAVEELQVERRFYGAVALSPDGSRIAAQVHPAVGPQELWVLDLESGREAALKSGWTTGSFSWWPDGESLLYFETAVGEVGEGRGRLIRHYLRDMVSTDTLEFLGAPSHVSGDARWILGGRFNWTDPPPGLWVYDVEADTAALVHDNPTATLSRFSPDAAWITWTHLQGDQFQIFVAPFDEGAIGGERLVGPGFAPAWTHDSGRLYWYEPESIRLMFAEPPDFVPQEVMVMPRFMPRPGRDLDVAPDGRILYVPTAEQAPISRLTVVTNWAAALPVAGG